MKLFSSTVPGVLRPTFKFNYQQGRLYKMQVIQQWFGVLDVSELGFIEMMLFAHVVVPVHAFGQKTMPAVMMFCNRPQDSQPIGKI